MLKKEFLITRVDFLNDPLIFAKYHILWSKGEIEIKSDNKWFLKQMQFPNYLILWLLMGDIYNRHNT